MPFENFYRRDEQAFLASPDDDSSSEPMDNASSKHSDVVDLLTCRSELCVPEVLNIDDSTFEFDQLNIDDHKPRLKRGQSSSHVRLSHVDEHLSFVSVMLHEHWLIATRMLNDRFQQTLFDKQSPVDRSK